MKKILTRIISLVLFVYRTLEPAFYFWSYGWAIEASSRSRTLCKPSPFVKIVVNSPMKTMKSPIMRASMASLAQGERWQWRRRAKEVRDGAEPQPI
jgi:hypothetical protein